jgi:hypothetical protein
VALDPDKVERITGGKWQARRPVLPACAIEAAAKSPGRTACFGGFSSAFGLKIDGRYD